MMTIKNLPFPRKAGFKHATTYCLQEKLLLSNEDSFNTYVVEAGTEVKLITSTNFGLVVLPKNKPASNGQRLFRY